MSRIMDLSNHPQLSQQPVVYFVEIGKHVKIGFTARLDRRLKSFQTTALNVNLLFALPGDRSLEKKLHALLSESNVVRELFFADWRVMSFIDHVKFGGLSRGLRYLEETTPASRQKHKEEAHRQRVQAARQSKAEKDAFFASLVADRKRRIGK